MGHGFAQIDTDAGARSKCRREPPRRKPSELVFLLYDLPSFASFGYSLHFVVEDFVLIRDVGRF